MIMERMQVSISPMSMYAKIWNDCSSCMEVGLDCPVKKPVTALATLAMPESPDEDERLILITAVNIRNTISITIEVPVKSGLAGLLMIQKIKTHKTIAAAAMTTTGLINMSEHLSFLQNAFLQQ